METTNIWYMHHLFGRKIVLLMCMVMVAITISYGQRDNYNYRDFQNKPYYFGLTLGLNNSSYKINHGKNFNNPSKYRVVEPDGQMGFNLNMIGNLKLGEFFDFRVMPGFSFTERKLIYTEEDNDQPINEGRESVFFEIPIHVRYKSMPYKDKRMFVVGGVKYLYDVTSNSRSQKKDLKFSPHDYQVEVGLGIQFFYPYFIFSPEIKYSRGLGNTLIYDQSLDQTTILESVISQMITISFHFEG